MRTVLSGDTIVIRKQPRGGPPPEKVIALSGITAPKLARQRTANNDVESKDEPFAWEAREFLRKKLVGKEVVFISEKPNNSTTREYGSVWTGKDTTKDENVTEALLAEGLAKVREGGRNIPQLKRLVEIEDIAKSQGKGIWGSDISGHVRDIKWTIDNPKQFVNKYNGQPIKAIIEYVRDGSTVRLCLLPDFHQITLMLSGIRCPAVKQDGDSEPYAEEARFFLESRLLQKDVEVILESVNNNNFVGTILHPQGNIAEALLRQGFARCVDWSLAVMKSGASTLRTAERAARDAKLRMWTNYVSNAPVIAAKDKEFTATVLEVVNGDALVVKLSNNTTKKIFLASIRPPREKNSPDEEGKPSIRPKGFKPLYDIPWMFEAREFLRKKLIGKKVSVTVDYIQPAKDNFPEKTCCSVQASGMNIAEALVSKGYATVVRYSKDNDQRSSHYDKLLEAELKAQKAGIGIYAKKDIPAHRIQDTSGDSAKAKKFFPFLKRAQKTEATVEFVASGSRMRIYIPKESVLVTFLLAGINCPRGARPTAGGGTQEAEPFGEEALHYTKEKCLQHDVVVTIEEMDKAGNFIGWLWVDNENLSVSLVEHGLASMHHTAETSEFARVIKTAEENAIKKRIGIWKDYVEVEKEIEKEKNAPVQDRTVKYDKVIITEITPEGHFYAQNIESGAKLEALMDKIHQEFKANAPLPGSLAPRRGQVCAALFSADSQWYRAKVEKITEDKKVHIFYIDYGNREVVNYSRLASLPAGTEGEPPYATEYALCCVKFPADPDDRLEAVTAFSMDTLNKKLLLNVEARGAPAAVTLVDPATNQDVGKNLIKEGLVLLDAVRDRRLATLVSEYRAAQEHAKSSRLNLWQHGDITEDDAVEFGARR
ncbi:staphylococcal nuclease domain-containing protein 1 isoform X2 [Leguminivora glycinivorella]|uniref:staphylococcal nuclease domain-containing protein 1 isoform X2 n=1 Tax=Leguminivora glycinivorella TaxID=1035111 RepID=UPI00200FEE3E|nr:staphylococcal nuclease domain-containing protein 1 isoform X2 [Leguminivora glycinivorella]